jgi:hypothetical protein
MLTHNLIGKRDQLVVYAYKLINNGERNYSTIEHETLALVFAFHKFKITYYIINFCFMLTIWLWFI